MPVLDLIMRGIIAIGFVFIIFFAAPLFFEDCRNIWREYRKSSAEYESAERVNKKNSNYNISNFRNISNAKQLEKMIYTG